MIEIILLFILAYVLGCFILAVVDEFVLSNVEFKNYETIFDNFLFALWGIPLIGFLWGLDICVNVWYFFKYGR
jgi:hypothetical protein